MAPCFESAEVQCPFYKKTIISHRNNVVFCEGCKSCTHISVVFNSYYEYNTFVNKFCNEKYVACPYYQIALRKYL